MDTDCAFFEVGAQFFLYLIYMNSTLKSVNAVSVFFTADCSSADTGVFLERMTRGWSAFHCAVTLWLLPCRQLYRLWGWNLTNMLFILTEMPSIQSGCVT
jgi:hypothetical protein